MAAGICPGSCQGMGHLPWWKCLCDGPGDALELPVHYREIVQFYEMTHGVAVAIDGGGGS